MISRHELIVSHPAKNRDRTRAVYLRGTTRVVAHVVEPNGKGLGYQAIVKRLFAEPHRTQVFKTINECRDVIRRQI